MEKIEDKVASKCQKIEQKMQKKIDIYKEQIEQLQSLRNEDEVDENNSDNELDELAALENEINNLWSNLNITF